MESASENRLIDTAELGRAQSVSQSTIERWRAAGCPCVKISTRAYRYDLAAVRAWLEARQQAAKGAA